MWIVKQHIQLRTGGTGGGLHSNLILTMLEIVRGNGSGTDRDVFVKRPRYEATDEAVLDHFVQLEVLQGSPFPLCASDRWQHGMAVCGLTLWSC